MVCHGRSRRKFRSPSGTAPFYQFTSLWSTGTVSCNHTDSSARLQRMAKKREARGGDFSRGPGLFVPRPTWHAHGCQRLPPAHGGRGEWMSAAGRLSRTRRATAAGGPMKPLRGRPRRAQKKLVTAPGTIWSVGVGGMERDEGVGGCCEPASTPPRLIEPFVCKPLWSCSQFV
jgi:hypothetical protein